MSRGLFPNPAVARRLRRLDAMRVAREVQRREDDAEEGDVAEEPKVIRLPTSRTFLRPSTCGLSPRVCTTICGHKRKRTPEGGPSCPLVCRWPAQSWEAVNDD